MKDSFIYPIFFMSIVTAIYVLFLAVLNDSTAKAISFNESIDLQKKILYVFDIPYDEDDEEEINELFTNYIEVVEDENSDLADDEKTYMAKDINNKEEILGYAYPANGAGLWGSIKAYIGISSDYSTLLGLEFISQEETPGLGGRIDEKEFKEQFRGIELEEGKEDKFLIYKPAQGGNVDAIAGATLTSQAVADFINEDILSILDKLDGRD